MKLTKVLLMITATTALANCGSYVIPQPVGNAHAGQTVVIQPAAARSFAGGQCGAPGFQSLEIRCQPQPQSPVQYAPGGKLN